MTCSLGRYLLVAWAAGLLVSIVTGNDVLGWAAAAVAAAVAYGLPRRFPGRSRGRACARGTPGCGTREADQRGAAERGGARP